MVFVNIFTRKYYKKLLEFVYTCKFGGNIKFGVTHIIRYPVLEFADIRNIITFTSFYKFAMAINYIAIYHNFTYFCLIRISSKSENLQQRFQLCFSMSGLAAKLVHGSVLLSLPAGIRPFPVTATQSTVHHYADIRGRKIFQNL